MDLGLIGFATANLTDTVGGKTFIVSGWTKGGSLADGTVTADTVVASKNTGFILSDQSLSSPDGMNVSLMGIRTAILTATAARGYQNVVIDAGAFTGTTHLTVSGTLSGVLFGGSGNGSTLTAAGSGHDILIGGPGADTLTDTTTLQNAFPGTGAGLNILIGGGGADTITGNGRDILISGTTNYDSNTAANLAVLDTILAEWTSSDSYSTRIRKISSGITVGTKTYALNSTTVQSDGVVNTLSDGGGITLSNWLIVNSKDKLPRKSNEIVTIIN